MLRTRLFLNLLPFVVMLLAMGVYATALFSRLAHSVDATVMESYRSIVGAQAMSLALAGMEREAWAYPAKPGADNQVYAGHRRRFEENLVSQLKSSSLPGENQLNQALAAAYAAFQQGLRALGSATNSASRNRIYEQQITPNLLRMNTLLDKLRDLNHRAMLATSQNIQKLTGEVTRLMVAGMIVALVISAYACYQLSRSILQPIQLLTEATRELGQGNLARPVPIVSRDELGELARAFNNLAAQLQEYRQSTSEKIVRLHRTMETTLASFPDPIFVLGKEGQIELKNPAAQELISGLRLDGELPSPLRAIAQRTLESKENFLPHSFSEVVFYRINGSGKFFLPRILAMRDKQDALSGVAVVLYDVTRFRLLDAAKTNLVATVSHELKTPLTSLRMAVHLLLEGTVGSLAPRQTELLQTARDDTERLLRILNDLLDLARLEEGAADLHKEQIAPADLLQSVKEEMAEMLSSKGLKLTYAADPDLPPVLVDRQRIRHVFTNLINNAAKHSPEGGEILVRAEAAGDHSVRFSVSDHGPGIPEQYQARIFDRFFRVPGQTRTGAGLGLSIAREITVAHGGRIGVKSALGQGSTFYVVLKGEDAAA